MGSASLTRVAGCKPGQASSEGSGSGQQELVWLASI